MFLTMGVGLFTSRLVLQALGVEDYGIYGLVGGIVTMFSFLNSAMSSATQRYLSFDIGKGDTERLQKTFNATLNIHILIAGVILILAETIGLWFVNYKLNIPADRMQAANWVYQFSILTFILGVIQVPYNALLIAREHMNVYAYMSILESLLKLIIVLVLVKFGNDKLILYAILTFAVSFIIRTLYKLYCKKYFKESQYQFYYDKAYYKELLNYSGWNLFGNIAMVARGQGTNILINIFFGATVNAAYSLTLMVQGIVTTFVSNFQMAINPQIIKNYASGNTSKSLELINISVKASFFVMLILVVPFIINADYILHLWLDTVPTYTVEFVKLALIFILIETLSNPLLSGITATGNIKKYHVVISFFNFLNLPLLWFTFKLTNNPITLYAVFLPISLFLFFLRLYFAKKLMKLDIILFFKQVLFRIISVFIPLVIGYFLIEFQTENKTIFNVITESFTATAFTIIIIFFLGLNANERHLLSKIFKNKILRK